MRGKQHCNYLKILTFCIVINVYENFTCVNLSLSFVRMFLAARNGRAGLFRFKNNYKIIKLLIYLEQKIYLKERPRIIS